MTKTHDEKIKGSCHCGAVGFEYLGKPARLVSCNCSICRRLRPLWGHGTEANIRILGGKDATLAYVWGDKDLAFHTCKTCGCTISWHGLTGDSPRNMAVNMALCDPSDIAGLRLRHFDGADTWAFLD